MIRLRHADQNVTLTYDMSILHGGAVEDVEAFRLRCLAALARREIRGRTLQGWLAARLPEAAAGLGAYLETMNALRARV